MDTSSPSSLAELVELPARVAELARLMHAERAARLQLEASFRRADQSSLDALVEDRLELEAMKLRAEFAAEFPKHRQAISRMHDAREANAAAATRSLAAEELRTLMGREEGALAALRVEMRGEVREQLKEGLGVVCGTQDEWLNTIVAEQLAPLDFRLEAAERAVSALQESAEESAEMETIVLERLDDVVQAVASDVSLPQLPAEVGESILALRQLGEKHAQDLERIQADLGASGTVALEAAGSCEAALAALTETVAEMTGKIAVVKDESSLFEERLHASESAQAAQRASLTDAVEEAVARQEEAVAARLETVDDLGAAQGAKLFRVCGVVDEWEASAREAAREAAIEAASETLGRMQEEAAAGENTATTCDPQGWLWHRINQARHLYARSTAATATDRSFVFSAATNAVAPIASQVQLAEDGNRAATDELRRRLDDRPWEAALGLRYAHAPYTHSTRTAHAPHTHSTWTAHAQHKHSTRTAHG